VKIHFSHLELICRKSVEHVDFSPQVTFIHGPVGTGKSTVARLVDFCFGGSLIKTMALRNELLAAKLTATVGDYQTVLEREIEQNSTIRVTWEKGDDDRGSVLAPLQQVDTPILPNDIYTLSDLLFSFSGIDPIKVRKSKTDPDSELVRLSFRDIMWYCYLSQEDLDSSFFQMEHPFKRNKSIDVMRFVVGFHSERLNDLEQSIVQKQDQLRANRAAAAQIRAFLRRFELGSDVGIDVEIGQVKEELSRAQTRRAQIEAETLQNTHTVDPLRQRLRQLSRRLGREEEALHDLRERIAEQEALLADLISAKVKSARSDTAQSVLAGVRFSRCPQCGSPITEHRFASQDICDLCGQNPHDQRQFDATETEVLRQDLNTRIDELEELISQHQEELEKQQARVDSFKQRKVEQDQELNRELQQYDSAYVSQIRAVDREIAELNERQRQLQKLAELPRALEQMERESGELDAETRNIRAAIDDERKRLRSADARIRDIESTFLSTMLEIGFPGIGPGDRVEINRRNWQPRVFHGTDDHQGWDFDEAGSGGKRVLFNVCYALAVHRVAAEHNLPLPTFLIVDSPTKNISADVNPTLVANYFKLIYSLAEGILKNTQFLLIDSDLVQPTGHEIEFVERLLSPENPLISYYSGP
jgi:hypothetical protein